MRIRVIQSCPVDDSQMGIEKLIGKEYEVKTQCEHGVISISRLDFDGTEELINLNPLEYVILDPFSAKDIINEVADKNDLNWDVDTMTYLLSSFIGKHCSEKDFRDFINKKVASDLSLYR